jgi:hypothetical protein
VTASFSLAQVEPAPRSRMRCSRSTFANSLSSTPTANAPAISLTRFAHALGQGAPLRRRIRPMRWPRPTGWSTRRLSAWQNFREALSRSAGCVRNCGWPTSCISHWKPSCCALPESLGAAPCPAPAWPYSRRRGHSSCSAASHLTLSACWGILSGWPPACEGRWRRTLTADRIGCFNSQNGCGNCADLSTSSRSWRKRCRHAHR